MKALIAVLMLVVGLAAHAQEQFTLAWPLHEKALKPRGATTRGARVNLDPAPSEAWRRLREPGISDLERDRRGDAR